MKGALLLLTLVLLPAIGHAQDAPTRGIDENFFAAGGQLDAPSQTEEAAEIAQPRVETDELGASAFKVLGALVFVSLLIIGLYKLGRKARLPFLGGEGVIRRIAMEPIGPNQYINVVEIGGKVIVLGMSEKGITMLTELDGEQLDRVRLAHSSDDVKRSRQRPSFGSIFRSMGQMTAGDRADGAADPLGKERDRLKELAL